MENLTKTEWTRIAGSKITIENEKQVLWGFGSRRGIAKLVAHYGVTAIHGYCNSHKKYYIGIINQSI